MHRKGIDPTEANGIGEEGIDAIGSEEKGDGRAEMACAGNCGGIA